MKKYKKYTLLLFSFLFLSISAGCVLGMLIVGIVTSLAIAFSISTIAAVIFFETYNKIKI
jgi:hypothetical protein